MVRILTSILTYLFFLTASGQYQAIKQLNSAEFEKHIKDFSGTLLDVRTIGEFKNGTLKKLVN